MNDGRMNGTRRMLAALAGLAGVALMAGPGPRAMAQSQPPSDVKAIRQPQFDIDYQLGDSRATTVELWYTDDNSESWKLYGVDADRVSPISFTAPREGLYGFFVIARNSKGASANHPTKGTAPTFWCFVDWHRPQVQITGPAATPSPDGGGDILPLAPGAPLPLRYTALDDHLAEYIVEVSTSSGFPKNSTREVGEKLISGGRGQLSITADNNFFTSPNAVVWWRVGARIQGDKPGPVADKASGKRYIYSTPNRFTRPDSPPPPPAP